MKKLKAEVSREHLLRASIEKKLTSTEYALIQNRFSVLSDRLTKAEIAFLNKYFR